MAHVLEPGVARVLVVGKDPHITRVLMKLLELDDRIEPLGEAPTIAAAPIAQVQPDIIILDQADQPADAADAQMYVSEVAPRTRVCLLEDLQDLTVGDLLATVRLLAPHLPGQPRPALRILPGPAGRDALSALSERELEVVRLVAEGLSNKEISTRLSLSDKTVKNHISHILAKMNLTARTQVAVYALRTGLV